MQPAVVGRLGQDGTMSHLRVHNDRIEVHLTPAEKALARANADFMQRMRTKLSGDSLTRATTILGGP